MADKLCHKHYIHSAKTLRAMFHDFKHIYHKNNNSDMNVIKNSEALKQ
jgi:uncharacterized membrane-anchored protein YhcB (DUF1043 family)